MNKKYLAFIIVLVLAVAVLAVGLSLGWFMNDVGNDPNKAQQIDYGDFDYSFDGTYDILPVYTDTTLNIDYAAPGNMIYKEITQDNWSESPLAIINKSTIPTNLRVKIEYTRWDGAAFVQTIYGDSTVDFQVKNELGDPLGTDDGWSYDVVTKFWNYLPGGNPIPAVDFVNFPDGQNIIINSIGYSDQLGIGNVYENEAVTVKLTVEAKQADYATWNQVKGLG